jgi:hypothetical protein
MHQQYFVSLEYNSTYMDNIEHANDIILLGSVRFFLKHYFAMYWQHFACIEDFLQA